MTSVGRICLYCSRPISTEDRVALCDRCLAAHHEECWDRNGRCSTFRCPGLPQTMRGDGLPTTLQAAMLRSNMEPQSCPFCGNTVYAGTLQARLPQRPNQPAGSGLTFVSRYRPGQATGGIGGLFGRLAGQKSWVLPGGNIKARSCGKCRRLFLWGMPAEDLLAEKRGAPEVDERFCPHCSVPLWFGRIVLKRGTPGGARFECDSTPDFHRDWLGRNILDRYILNRWHPAFDSLPSHSCPECRYTEIAGRPIYRFL